MRLEAFERAFLVRPHQPRVARHIGGEDRGETAFGPISAQIFLQRRAAQARAAGDSISPTLLLRGEPNQRRDAVIEQTQMLIGAPSNSTPSTSPLVSLGFGSPAAV